MLIPLTVDTDQKDRFGKSPLQYAKESGWTEIVKLLSENSIDNFLKLVCNHPERPDIFGRLPLHLVCMESSLDFELNLRGRIELVNILVILTPNVDYQDEEGNTALHYAVQNGFYELVKILIKKCNVNIRNESKFKVKL